MNIRLEIERRLQTVSDSSLQAQTLMNQCYCRPGLTTLQGAVPGSIHASLNGGDHGVMAEMHRQRNLDVAQFQTDDDEDEVLEADGGIYFRKLEYVAGKTIVLCAWINN
ncbi:hypothetical protein DFS34DRAFT_650510 [Phlyctochytrium arcticum]|nr:hypothetical protein DFS34DRAFT_650510 [Phlyctochytrium arcticum]